jgi:tripartite-type tricarboxylate transporter receptor subunit TctC
MKYTRRDLLALSAAAVAWPALARAQSWPTRPVRWIVPFPPGGPTDILARTIGQWLTDRLGQPVVIDNRPGGGTNIGTEAVVRSPPDGYTLLMLGPSSTINPSLYPKLPFNVLRDLAPVSGLIRLPQVMAVHPGLPVHSVAEFIAYAKANPGKINFASAGVGSGPHLTGELFKMMTGIDMVHVPYRGVAPALTDLIAGQVQVMFVVPVGMFESMKAGKLRGLAVTSATRSDVLPELPTVGETVPGYEASTWFGLGAPKDTPADIVERLNREITAGLVDPKIKTRFTDMGAVVLTGPASDFGKLLADETAKWAKVVKATGASAN